MPYGTEGCIVTPILSKGPTDTYYATDAVTEDVTVHVAVERDGQNTEDAVVSLILQHCGTSNFQLTQRMDEMEDIALFILDRLEEARTTLDGEHFSVLAG